MSNKNILIMGFGTQAVRYLECAKLNECEISAGELEEFFLCDYNKEYVKLIDNRISYNSFENEMFLEMIRKINSRKKLQGILPLTDTHVQSTAFAAQELGLKSAGIKASILSTNKSYQRTVFKLNSIKVPKYNVVDLETMDEAMLEKLEYPKVFKPVNKYGSIGVKIINNKSEAMEHINNLKYYSNVCLIEEYIVGQEVSIESVVQNKKIEFVNITKKYLGKLPLFIEESHLVPYDTIDSSIKDKLYELNEKVISVLGVEDSLVHLEAKIDGNEVVVMEVAVRMPGDRIMDLIEISTGVNLYDCAVKLALGEKVNCKRSKHLYSQVYWFSSPQAGIIKKIDGLEDIDKMPETVMTGLLKQPGEYINKLESSFDRVGFCIGKAEYPNKLGTYIKRVKEKFFVEVVEQ